MSKQTDLQRQSELKGPGQVGAYSRVSGKLDTVSLGQLLPVCSLAAL